MSLSLTHRKYGAQEELAEQGRSAGKDALHHRDTNPGCKDVAGVFLNIVGSDET